MSDSSLCGEKLTFPLHTYYPGLSNCQLAANKNKWLTPFEGSHSTAYAEFKCGCLYYDLWLLSKQSMKYMHDYSCQILIWNTKCMLKNYKMQKELCCICTLKFNKKKKKKNAWPNYKMHAQFIHKVSISKTYFW